jgi:hypothetical protein
MHPYISQAIAEARVADWIREAEARGRAQAFRDEAATRGQLSHRGRRHARRRASTGMTTTGAACR